MIRYTSPMGFDAVLFESRAGYSVQLQDTDTGEWLPTIKRFKTYEAARAYALRCVQV